MWGRSLAAALLGLPLAVGLVGLLALAWPGRLEATTLPWLLLAFPVWIAAMSLAFACRTGLRAWLWLGGATALCFGLIHACKWLGWVEVGA
ncbi:hypothetical protein B1992_07375 [Pseudoxanthomonas broegbernensis]|uniref:DUF4175 domain-containing protein n=1 Tax=Pseudoxanthomonas broegbernensis TaxID=83619 RepID=A0A7V8K7M1_9GAMM|nr:hypothetical protein [Pseudoxanthomonas broegbernensis]KAF1686716.1 hypothetical protein B1992_07375 [Pseudoxanthomonas broegbernensis]MBB6063519.1 ABC-type uncharacterized transport system permease subunit [Pseudoxanthomonas broegbernensis]